MEGNQPLKSFPYILTDISKIFAPRSLDIPQRPENFVHFCESASSESGSHNVTLETIPAVSSKR